MLWHPRAQNWGSTEHLVSFRRCCSNGEHQFSNTHTRLPAGSFCAERTAHSPFIHHGLSFFPLQDSPRDKSRSLASIAPQRRPQGVTQHSLATTSTSHFFPASAKLESRSEQLSKPLPLTPTSVKIKKVNINYFPSLLILAETFG